jgi:hypothetical protein
MTKRRKPSQPNEGIQANIINAQAVAAGRGAKAIVNQDSQTSPREIADAFAVLYEKVQNMPEGADKNIAKDSIKALEMEAQKGEQADKSTIEKWMNFLAQTAPAAFEVAVATFLNPIQGLGIAFQKIAERAREEQKKQ